jgi:PTS system nitrogen regulatory IIA component
MMILGLLNRGIDFKSIDGRPVHAVFLTITPTTRSHLHILSRLGYVLQDLEVRKALADRAPAERILAAVQAAESRLVDPGDDD